MSHIPPSPTMSGPKTRAAFEYQDKAVAHTILARLLTGELDSVMIEYATDLVVIPKNGSPELVSVKFRSPQQRGSTGWTFSALKADNVLIELYRFWDASGRQATATVHTPAGLQHEAVALRTHHTQAAARNVVLAHLESLGLPPEDAATFAGHLMWPEHPLPGANHIDGVNRSLVVDLLRTNGISPIGADAGYDTLLALVGRASSHGPEGERCYVTVAAAVAKAKQDTYDRHHLSADRLRDAIIRTAQAAVPPTRRATDLHPDPNHVPRPDLSTRLYDATTADEHGRRPVALVGPSGTGKTTTAIAWCAGLPTNPQIVFLDGSSRAALTRDLHRTLGHPCTPSRTAPGAGSASAELPDSDDLVILIDGVVDPTTLDNLIPHHSRSRIIITSTRGDLDPNISQIPVGPLTEPQAHHLLQHYWSDLSEAERDRLVHRLDANPLALMHAAAMCTTADITLDRYLKALDQAPERILDQGHIGNHPQSLAASLALSLESIRKDDPATLDLLTFMALLGPHGFSPDDPPPHVIAILNGQEYFDPDESDEPTAGAVHLGDLLADYAGTISAIHILRVRQFITATPTGRFRTHPLIAEITLALADDLRPHLEVAASILAPYSGEQRRHGMERAALLTRAIVRIADKRRITGPALSIACLFTAPWMSTIGDAASGELMAARAQAWAEQGMHRGLLTRDMHLLASSNYAACMANNNNPEGGANFLSTLLQATLDPEVALDANEQSIVGTACSNLASMTFDMGSTLDDLLPLVRSLSGRYPECAHLRYATLRGVLTEAWRTGNAEAAKGVIDEAYDVARRHSLDASSIARFGIAFARHSKLFDAQKWGQTLTEFADSVMETSPSIAASILLDAADALLDADDRHLIGESNTLQNANEIVQAGGLLRRVRHLLTPDSHPAWEGQYAAVLGRLHLHGWFRAGGTSEGKLRRAESELRRSVDILRGRRSMTGDLAGALYNLAKVLMFLGDQAEALAAAQESRELELSRHGPNHPELKATDELIVLLSESPSSHKNT